MNMNTNWFTNDASSAYQHELYRTAENERLANEARRADNRRAQPAPSTNKAAHKRTTQTMAVVPQTN
jgi:hypothetical protein